MSSENNVEKKQNVKAKKQFLLVTKPCRRYSVPDCFPTTSETVVDEQFRTRMSLSDLSFLLEVHSTESSEELDTSNMSNLSNLSLNMTPRSMAGSPRCSESYQNISFTNQERGARICQDMFLYTLCSRSIWKTVFYGQLLAVFITIMMAANEVSKKNNIHYFVNGQNFPCYLLLAIVWTTQLAWRRGGRGILDVIRLSGLRYLLLAALHVEGNFLLFSAFEYNSYLGNQIIDCVAASLSFVLAYASLDIQFQTTHASGFLIVQLGAIGLTIADSSIENDVDPGEISWGDIARVGSGLFIAFNSLAQELIVKSIDSVEYLGMIGFLGCIICGGQTVIFEPHSLLVSTWGCWLALAIFSLSQFMFTSLVPRLLRDVGATGLHLSLVSSGFYCYILKGIIDVEKIMYFISYFLVLLGCYLFTVRRTSIIKHYFFPVKITITKGDS